MDQVNRFAAGAAMRDNSTGEIHKRPGRGISWAEGCEAIGMPGIALERVDGPPQAQGGESICSSPVARLGWETSGVSQSGHNTLSTNSSSPSKDAFRQPERQWRSDRPQLTSKRNSISTEAFNGSAFTPTAARAWRPASPNSVCSNSLAPLATCG